MWKKQQFFQSLKKIRHKEFYALVVLVLFLFLLQFFYLNSRLQNYTSGKSAQTTKQALNDSLLWFDLDTTLSRAQGRISFSIEGAPQGAVSLWHNGRLIAMQPNNAQSGDFTNVPLYFGENRFVLWEHRADGRVALIDSFRITWDSARLRFLSRSLYRVPLKQKLVALTFDAGSTDKGSLEILRILKDKKVRCTIFVTGRFLQMYPEIVRQMILDGHEVGNHTFSHPHLTTFADNNQQETLARINRRFIIRQLTRTDSLFRAITGKHLAPYWRAPFGELNRQILRWAAEAGFKHVGWSEHCDALDWVADSSSALYHSSKQILQHFLRLEETSGLQGRIILMHLSSDRKKDDAYQILPSLIDSLRQRGYRFVTVGELISAKHRQNWAQKQ